MTSNLTPASLALGITAARCVLRRRFRRSATAQIALLLAIWQLGSSLARATQCPVPGPIAGMALLLVLLSTRCLSLRSLKRGSDWVLAEMLLFFVPAVLVVLDHQELLGLLGLKLIAIIVVGTIGVMTATALIVDALYRWWEPHRVAAP